MGGGVSLRTGFEVSKAHPIPSVSQLLLQCHAFLLAAMISTVMVMDPNLLEP